MHSYQRQVKRAENRGQVIEYIEVQPSDIALANRLAHEVLGRMLDEMPTQMLENGAELRWIQVMQGHRSVESTQIYTQVSIRALQAVHASTHPAEQREKNMPGVADGK